jgi:hypothetical protein
MSLKICLGDLVEANTGSIPNQNDFDWNLSLHSCMVSIRASLFTEPSKFFLEIWRESVSATALIMRGALV